MEREAMIWFYLIVAAIIAKPLVQEAIRKPMNQKARADAPGSFAKLSQGVTHYQWYGPMDGPVAVCIHGLTTPSFVWRGLANGLALMGYRVLVYDLYGRGYSDRVRGVQDRAFFMQQLADLLADQDLEDNITLIGYSMGGAIAAIFAASQPDRIRHLILLAPAGMKPLGKGIAGYAALTPVIGAWLMLQRYPSILRKGIAAEQGGPSSVEGISAMQEAELHRRGFISAVRSSLKGVLSEDLSKDQITLKTEAVPLLAIWGAEDSIIPLTCSDALKEWNERAQNEVIAGAGHGLPYSHTIEVLEHIDRVVHQNG
ncbi:MAG: alpha/beta hydrolase [Paracoccaceae bacterium]|nr:alpha/beta hydrolase [Paracoccaceae bacterium]